MSSRLLHIPGSDAARPLPAACRGLTVDGRRHHHSAAKFWPRLIDESVAEFADCTRLELAAVTSEALDPVRLDPRAELQRDADALAGRDLADIIRESTAQLALLGPPGLVRIRILARDRACYAGELPGDSVDAEIFVYLAAWLLEWSRVPHGTWSQPALAGQFVGRDPGRHLVYHVRFDLRREPVREGLHRIVATLEPRVEPNL